MKFDDQVTIELETLWVLENMTYCCETKDDMFQLVMKVSGTENLHIRNMLFRSFRVDVESDRPLNEAHRDLQKFYIALTILGNILHMRSMASFMILN